MKCVEALAGHSQNQGGPTIKTIVNKTRKPVRISLPGGKTLHLGLGGRGQVPNDVLERPSFKKLLDAGEIEVLGDVDRSEIVDDRSTRIRRSTHEHPALRNVSRKGDR